MVSVLMIAGAVPRQEAVLVKALRQFREQGVQVRLVCNFSLKRLRLDPKLAQVHSLGAAAAPPGMLRAEPSRALWLRARRDRVVRTWMREADVMVSLDTLAVYTVWELAQRQLRADACQGLVPAARAVQARLDGTPLRQPPLTVGVGARARASASALARSTRQGALAAANRSVRASMSPAVMRTGVGAVFWQAVTAAPALPDRIRTGLTHRVHIRLVKAERPRAAAATTARTIARLKNRQAQIGLLAREAKSELSNGLVPVCLQKTVSSQLAMADEFFAKKNPTKASQFAYQAIRLLFNPVPQLEQASSPLVDPGYLDSLRSSAVGQALAAPRGRSVPAAPAPADRPLRLLLLTRSEHQGSDIPQLRRHYSLRPGVELRHLQLDSDPTAEKLARNAPAMVEHRLSGDTTPYGSRVADWLEPHLRWADTVLVDSCSAAALLTLVDPGDTRIIARLHDIDIADFWGQLIDFSRIDDVVFVSAHLRDLATAAAPLLGSADGPAAHIVPAALDLQPHQQTKAPNAQFTLGVLGSDTAAKDAFWAIEVLRLLRAEDKRYELLLIGDDPDTVTGAVNRRYLDNLARQIDAFGPGITHRAGVENVAQSLPEVGVVLSSSKRETFHRTLVEGAASGALPVVRDWPFFGDLPHGAGDLFPADWLVETPRQAADRILAATQDEQTWASAGADTSKHALTTWDWSVVHPHYDSLLRVPVADAAR